MKFALEVGGDAEKFLLEYESSQLLGNTVIRVNSKEVKRLRRLFSRSKTETHDLHLGEMEPVVVRIETEPRFPFGERNRVFVNSRLVKLYEGV